MALTPTSTPTLTPGPYISLSLGLERFSWELNYTPSRLFSYQWICLGRFLFNPYLIPIQSLFNPYLTTHRAACSATSGYASVSAGRQCWASVLAEFQRFDL